MRNLLMKLSLFAFLAGAMLPSSAVSQTFKAEKTTGEWLVSSVLGANVKNNKDETVGDINDIVLNGDGAVTAYIIGVGGFLGIAEKNVAVSKGDITVSWDGDDNAVLTTAVSKDAFEKAPEFKRVSATQKAIETVKQKTNEAVEAAKDVLESASEKVEDAGDKVEEKTKEAVE